MIEDAREPDLSEPEATGCDGSGWDSVAKEPCEGCEECAPEAFYRERERAAVIALLRHCAKLARSSGATGPFGIPLDQAIDDIERGKHLKP